ncbi:MAG: sulfite exporter TauE/SafE family protein [Acidobacteria bacterium]|nr:sulfite exporter TauE/SafE family protein [Acidobacteriota bacterium]
MHDPSSLLLVATGAATGLVGALLGLGGGVFLVPLLTLALGVPIRAAIAASLISVIATASASATVNLNRGLVNMRLGLVLEVATSVGGLAGGLTASLLTPHQLFLSFAVTLATMGVVMAARSGRRNVIADPDAEPGLLGGRIQEGETSYVYRVKRLPFGLVASLVAGAISGLLGLGGGIIKVPVLSSFCGIPIRVAAATSAFMIGVTAAASAFIYFSRGDVAVPLTAAVALGALPASLLGAHLSERVRARSLKVLMAVVLVVVAVRMGLEGL